MSAFAPSIPTRAPRPFPVRAARAIAVGALRILGAVVVAVLMIPALLLFVATLVPLPVALAVVAADAALVIAFLRSARSARVVVAFLLAVIAVSGVALWLTQAYAATPAILGVDGNPLPGSIASLEQIKLGGADQWVVIRGQSVDNPVLLFLSGGPGGSELGRVRRFNEPLEEQFVVAVWEQRGCGKSYWAGPTSALTVDQYVADIIELSEILRARFGEDKVYLMGHSWGSIIGVKAVQQRPDLFHAYIGAGQMVNVRETDQTIYRMLLDHARSTGDTAFAGELAALGEPPYSGPSPIFQYIKVLGREYGVFEGPYIKNERYKREGDLAGQALIPEYGWLDRVNFMRGAMDTFNVVYPQLQALDFRRDAPQFDVPVYFFLGRHDVNATYWVAEDYFNTLRAPRKRAEIFEDSGHGQIWQEADRFHALMREVVAETYPTTR